MKRIDMRTRFILLAAVAAALAACGPKVGPEPVGKRADALEASAWDVSQWISVVNAPERVISSENGDRAADGASWFLSTVKNGKKVTKAVWLTAGLGVYDLSSPILRRRSVPSPMTSPTPSSRRRGRRTSSLRR